MTRSLSLVIPIFLFTFLSHAVAKEGMPISGTPAAWASGDFITGFNGLGALVTNDDKGNGQSRASKANDATASQWTYQLGHQWMEYHTDDIEPGVQRPKGVKRFWMARFILPLPKSESLPITLLPRLSVRYATAQDGKTGLGASDLFVLGIIADWGTGRFGLGPLVTFPASDDRLGLTDWTYGIASGLTQRYLDDRLYIAAIVSQTWGPLAPFLPEAQDIEAPLTVNPVAVYQLNDKWYVSNGDMIIRYDWHKGDWYVPIGLRLGRLWIQEKGTWNVYGEYQTSLFYKDWEASAIKDQFRLNLSYTAPF